MLAEILVFYVRAIPEIIIFYGEVFFPGLTAKGFPETKRLV